MSDSSQVIDEFFGDAKTPIEWASDEEKRLHFWLDDLHCPQPVSPMWFDMGGWWLTCDYMYRRSGAPFGKDWVAKKIEVTSTAPSSHAIRRKPRRSRRTTRW